MFKGSQVNGLKQGKGTIVDKTTGVTIESTFDKGQAVGDIKVLNPIYYEQVTFFSTKDFKFWSGILKLQTNKVG